MRIVKARLRFGAQRAGKHERTTGAVGARLNSPWIAHVIELPPGRQTCLYTVMPLYHSELLETRLSRRPSLALE